MSSSLFLLSSEFEKYRKKVSCLFTRVKNLEQNGTGAVTDEQVNTAVTTYLTDNPVQITTDATPTQGSTNPVQSGGVYSGLSGKVDKVAGKGLSTNDYDDTEKASVAANTAVRHMHTNKALLDTYTQTEANLADTVAKKHSHTNQAALDAVSGANTGDETGTGIKTKLESLTGTNRLDATAIQNLPSGSEPTETTIGTLISSAAEKTTINDNDNIAISDSENTNILKRFTWANLVVTLKALFAFFFGQTADYIIEKFGSTYYAKPRIWSGLASYSGTDAYTVIQNAINALTPAGPQGSAGGKIVIGRGTYSLSNELTITGWEAANPPFSQIQIAGVGYSTKIIQNTIGKNAIVIKNRAGIILRDMYIGIGAGALSAILADKNGANSEMSIMGGMIDNIKVVSSGSAPAVYLKNFMTLTVPHLDVYSYNNHAVMLENNSTVTQFGNSRFGTLYASGPADNNYAAVYIYSTNNKPMNLNRFGSLVLGVVGGYGSNAGKGLWINGGSTNSIGQIDAEYMLNPIYIDGTSGVRESSGNRIQSGYIYPAVSGTGIYCAEATSANTFILDNIEGDNETITIINDNQKWRPANDFDVTIGAFLDINKVSIATPNETPIKVKQNGTGLTYIKVPTPPSDANDNRIATAKWVNDKLLTLDGGSGGGDAILTALQILGSPLKAQSVGLNILEANAANAMTDGSPRAQAVYLSTAQSITGISVIIKTAGVFTEDNTNSVALFSYSNGTITKVAESANSAAFLKTAGIAQIPLTTPYSAQAGLYFVVVLYNSSSQTTAPAMGGGVTLGFTSQTTALAANGGKLTANILGSYNTMPATVDLGTVQTANVPVWVALY